MTPDGKLTGGTPASLMAARLTVAAETGDNGEVLRLLSQLKTDPELAAAACGVLAYSAAGLARQLSMAQAALRD